MGRGKDTISSTSLLAAMVGLGSYWAWMNLSAANATAFPWLAESIYPPQLLLSSCCYLAAMVLLFACGAKSKVVARRVFLEGAGLGCAVIGSVLTALGSALRAPLLVALGAITSFGTAVLLVYWGAFFSRCQPRQVAIMTAGSFTWGTFLYLALSELVSDRLVYALPALLLLFGVTLLVLERIAGSSEGLPARKLSDSLKGAVAPRGVVVILGCLGVCVVLNEVLRIVATPLAADDFSRVGSLTQFGGLLLSAAALVSVLVSKKPFSFNAMALVLVPLMVAGFLSFLVFSESGSLSMFILLGAGYWCLNLLVWIALCNVVHRTQVSAVQSFALFYGIIQVAILLAKPIGDWALRYLSVTSSGLSLIVSIAVLAVVIAALLLLRDRKITSLFVADGPDREQPATQEEEVSGSTGDRFNPEWLTSLAGEYGLTPRETEVFLLLARGRSLPVIREELSIATGTAQTHIRHIYEKMGIHSRQEFFDCIERGSDTRSEYGK